MGLLKHISPISKYIKELLQFSIMSLDTNSENCAKKLKLDNTKTIKEGKAEILVTSTNVFYNPVQEFNRDLSISVLTIFARRRWNELLQKTAKKKEKKTCTEDRSDPSMQNGLNILEALAATGLRSIRYAKEVEGIKQIIANDFSLRAVECLKRNIDHNEVENLVKPNCADATTLMYENKQTFNVIDLDPYGCPSMFLDGAVQSLSEGGLLMVTATDMAVLAGNSPETCYVKYGALPLKSKACHEIALRILLQTIASHAGRYGRYIVPLLSISADFYIRVFVRIFTSQLKCKENTSKLGMVYQCSGCESLTTQPLGVKTSAGAFKLSTAPAVDQHCKYCNHKHHMGGPIWLSSLHDKEFVLELLSNLSAMELGTSKRIEGVLNVVYEELDVPLYYTLDRVMSIVKCHTPQMLMFRSALLNAGYKVSYSHANKISIKTDAPNEVIWDIVRAWEKLHPKNRDKFPKDSPALAILDAPSTTSISFNIHPLANPASREKHLSRFQQNPTEYWGPGTRSRMMCDLGKKQKEDSDEVQKCSDDETAKNNKH